MTTRWLYNNPLSLQTNLNILHRNGGVFTVNEHKKITKNFCWLYDNPLTLQQPADFADKFKHPTLEQRCFHSYWAQKKSPKNFADFMTTCWLYNNLLTLQTNLNILHWNRGVFTVNEHKKITKKFCWLYDNPLTLQTNLNILHWNKGVFTVIEHKKSPKNFADFMTTCWLYSNLLTLQTNPCTLHWNKGVSTLIQK